MKKQANYREIFSLGVIFTGLGVVFTSSTDGRLGIVIMGLGIIYMIIGAKNKDKWKER